MVLGKSKSQFNKKYPEKSQGDIYFSVEHLFLLFILYNIL